MVFSRQLRARFAGADCPNRATRCLADPYHGTGIWVVAVEGLDPYVLNHTLFAGVTERVNVGYLLTNGYVERVPYASPRPPAKPPVPAA